jgi:hypothetical protein
MTFDSIDVIDGSELIDDPQQRSGRAVWDSRGNSIWEWQTHPGVFTRDISDHQLLQLQASHLTLVDAVALSPPAKEHKLRRAG